MNTGDFLAQWLDTFVRPFRAPNTAACYRRAIESLPATVTGCELGELNALLLQAAINRQAEQHPRAAQLTYATLHAAMAKAEQLQLVPRSPMVGCVKPIHVPRRAEVLTLQQLASYLCAAREQPGFVLLLLMAVCGLRRSEALGLQWTDIDLGGGSITIRRQRLRSAHGYRAAKLKSRSAQRVLPLPPPLASELAALRADQRERAFGGWVCDMTPEALRRAHRAALAAADLPLGVTLHGLRHSMATAAAAAGTPMKILQGILGHSKYDLTANLYADHISPEAFLPSMALLASQMLGRYQTV